MPIDIHIPSQDKRGKRDDKEILIYKVNRDNNEILTYKAMKNIKERRDGQDFEI